MKGLKETLDVAAEAMSESPVFDAYAERHGVRAAPFLTVVDDETADMIAGHLAPRITGKTVVEIGGGIGLLALHMARCATRVFCIEANPVWASTFVQLLIAEKPRNASFLLGSADEFVGTIRADVAVFCTHSGVDAMKLVAAQFAPVVIDVYGELIAANPEHFDKLARALRPLA